MTTRNAGVWYGLEMDLEMDGRNSGDVKGVKIFPCMPGHGLFVRPLAVIPMNAQ